RFITSNECRPANRAAVNCGCPCPTAEVTPTPLIKSSATLQLPVQQGRQLADIPRSKQIYPGYTQAQRLQNEVDDFRAIHRVRTQVLQTIVGAECMALQVRQDFARVSHYDCVDVVSGHISALFVGRDPVSSVVRV